jgi:poly [ADP-ribose] polymerase
MLVCRVALGDIKDYTKVTYGLTEPPSGYNSVHGVRSTPSNPTDFVDDEYVIFDPTQQQQEYLVEFHFKSEPSELTSTITATTTTTPIPNSLLLSSTQANEKQQGSWIIFSSYLSTKN